MGRWARWVRWARIAGVAAECAAGAGRLEFSFFAARVKWTRIKWTRVKWTHIARTHVRQLKFHGATAVDRNRVDLITSGACRRRQFKKSSGQ